MNRKVLVGILLIFMIPSILYHCRTFHNYDVCPHSKQYGQVYPAGTFVLKQKCVTELSRMLQIVVHALEACSIPYFICGGSLLGYARHNKKMIPFDDDIDLCIFASDEELRKVERYLPEGLRLMWFMGWWKIVSDGIHFMDRLAICIDLFQVIQQNGNVVLQNDYARSTWPKTKYPSDLVFPLYEDMFCGVPVMLPRDPIAVLKGEYGDDCMDVAYVNNVHSPLPYLALNFSLQSKPSKKISLT